MKMKFVWLVILLTGLVQTGVVHAQELEFQVELMNGVGTETNRSGDVLSARVISPSGFQGSIMEGKITESKSGAKSGGESVLDINFNMLRHNNTAIPIDSKIKSVGNSKGQANVDENGRVIGRGSSSNKPSSGLGGLGRAVGGIWGGKAEKIGAAVDTAAPIFFSVSSDAPNLRFDPGSRFTLTASARSGPALATLASSSSATAASSPETSQQSTGGSAQPNFATLRDEFMPGDNTVFYDDFTDMAAGDAPPHFKVRGASPDLMASGSIRQLTFKNAKGTLIPNLTSLPKNFTYEALIKVEPKGRSDSNLILFSKGKQILHWWLSIQPNQLDVVVSLRDPYSELGRKRVSVNLNEPIKLALWVQNGRMRSYVNGEKQLDFNQINLPPIDKVELENSCNAAASLGYRTVRFAESMPDFSQVISSSGRYIARGILFDTDSDVMKPESAPVIRQIAKGLETNPNLKLLIEGHTDSVGNAAHNMDLSKRRAEAVRSVLISQFNVDAARLTAAGLGSTKPVDTNDTPQGRAQNRRVELVKQ